MKRVLLPVILCCVFGFIGCSPAVNDNGGGINTADIKGVIAQNQTWSDQGKTYHITGTLTINANVVWSRKIHVLVDPNVTIIINSNGTLAVQEGVNAQFGAGAYVEVGYATSGTL
jgi:hypothetical protein